MKHSILIFFILFTLSATLSAQDSLYKFFELNINFDYFLRNSINGGGDFNGDGYGDLITTKYITSQVSYLVSEVKIYLGGEHPDTLADYVITSSDPEEQFGYWVCSDGDLNGDGFDDLVISSHSYTDPVYQIYKEGKVEIYWGGTDFDTIPDVTLYGRDYIDDAWYLVFGYCVNISGDFNNDGISDLVVSSNGPDGWLYGQAEIFFGSSSFNTINDFHVQGSDCSYLGLNITTGDFNGDNFDDLALLRFGSGDSQDIYFYEGGVNMDSQLDQIFTEKGPSPDVIENLFEMGGDYNADGFDDMVVKTGRHEVKILWGNSNSSFDNCDSIVTDLNIVNIMHSDINNDSISDLIIRNFTFLEGSEVLIYSGSSSFDLNYDLSIIDNTTFQHGFANQKAFDFNGDGYNDIFFQLYNSLDSSRTIQAYSIVEIQAAQNNTRPYIDLQLRNYPNPFNPSTTIEYSLPESGEVEVSIYNIKGQKVKQLVKECQEPGTHTILWNGTDNNNSSVGSGVYFYKIKTEKLSLTNKMIMLK